ncbi:Retrovirus-related Pol polyprotein from transposon TNT 1-94 [Gossypium australe]|uniref:Retrovirus-related Pol polyprotein from transposon TNT 1-94 n=1 Tax=Gossypium australe TaxID=47621 RepID=A0A5B6WY52_9ROSI|nr:Retrovirus-related Pol polyprotein from transposon TNT 1-94 [Gossypium australe]
MSIVPPTSVILLDMCATSQPSLQPLLSRTESPSSLASSSTPPNNFHPMATRSKVGIFKPKAYTVTTIVSPTEPFNIHEAISISSLKNAVYDELSHVVCKWFFKNEKNPDDSVARNKVHLVA